MPSTLLLLSMLAASQDLPVSSAQPRTVEAGGFRHAVSAGEPDWTGAQLTAMWNPPARVRPVFGLEWQTRRDRSQLMGSAGAYVDWSSRFYTFQTIAIGEHVPQDARYYPLQRGDIRGFLKLPRHEQVVAAAGFTLLTFGNSQTAQIYNGGLLYYRGKSILQVTAYVNHTHPGSLLSGAGNIAVQRGAEGRGWYGGSVSAGREVYRLGAGLGVANADFTTLTASAFARKWLTPAIGVHSFVEFQRVLDSYSRLGVTSRVFVNF